MGDFHVLIRLVAASVAAFFLVGGKSVCEAGVVHPGMAYPGGGKSFLSPDSGRISIPDSALLVAAASVPSSIQFLAFERLAATFPAEARQGDSRFLTRSGLAGGGWFAGFDPLSASGIDDAGSGPVLTRAQQAGGVTRLAGNPGRQTAADPWFHAGSGAEARSRFSLMLLAVLGLAVLTIRRRSSGY